MFDDPDYRPRTARPHRAPTAGRELTNHWPVYGHEVVSAATEIAEHALDFLPRGEKPG